MKLPDPRCDFSHSFVEHAEVGPRREVTLLISVLEWSGSIGKYSAPMRVRFGGVVNFDEVAKFFRDHPSLELAYLRPSREHRSKPGGIFIEMHAERIDADLLIQCSSVQVA